MAERRKPGSMFRATDFGAVDGGDRSGHERAPQIAIALFTDAAEPLHAPT